MRFRRDLVWLVLLLAVAASALRAPHPQMPERSIHRLDFSSHPVHPHRYTRSEFHLRTLGEEADYECVLEKSGQVYSQRGHLDARQCREVLEQLERAGVWEVGDGGSDGRPHVDFVVEVGGPNGSHLARFRGAPSERHEIFLRFMRTGLPGQVRRQLMRRWKLERSRC